MKELEVNLPNCKYSIVIRNDFALLKKRIVSLFKGQKIVIITDDNVANIYLNELKKLLADSTYEIFSFVVTHGEKSKSIETACQIYDFLLSIHFERSDIIIALGGGVVGDLSGYVAATYLRGIAFVQIPTTLLSQVDSSIGGKVAVNFNGVKNIIGAFYQPMLVYINTRVLQTLSECEFKNGLAEVIVHGIIQDASLLSFVSEHFAQSFNVADDLIEELIYRNCEIKAHIVIQDEKDKGIRRILNFGHTVGHAVESIFDYQYAHGECVSVGIVAAFKMSVFYKLIDEEKLIYIKTILNALKLPVEIKDLDWGKVVQKIKHDKKMDFGDVTFIMPTDIGSVSDFKIKIDTIPQIFK